MQLIDHFEAEILVKDIILLFTQAGEVYEDCKDLQTQVDIVNNSVKKMTDAFKFDLKSAVIKLVMAVVAEGTNIVSQVNNMKTDVESGKYFEAGNIMGEIVALLTIKLY